MLLLVLRLGGLGKDKGFPPFPLCLRPSKCSISDVVVAALGRGA